MSVIGIDFGNDSCYVAAAQAGGIEVLANEYSLRATPSCVAFLNSNRLIGVAAKNQQVTNINNTFCGLKRLLGRKYFDRIVQMEKQNIPNTLVEHGEGNVAFKVQYMQEEHHFTTEQLTAMLFTKLKQTASNALLTRVKDCVITCPIFFRNAQRKALLSAAQIAGLNVLQLMNENTATALTYGFYKQDLSEKNPLNVIFVDFGHSALQISACALTKGQLTMIASSWERIGGRDFDDVLYDYFCRDFYERYGMDVRGNERATLRLRTEIEKLKKQMSANSNELPLQIECFIGDIDVTASIKRSLMEELCANLLQRIEMAFRMLLKQSHLSLQDIHSVEIVGGSSRLPALKNLIEKVFKRTPSTTLNQDESVARGAALQCAIISPAVRVRAFGITDIQNYAIYVSWGNDDSSIAAREIEIFAKFNAVPYSRVINVYRKQPFTMTLNYAETVPYPDRVIGKWTIKNVMPTEYGDYQKIKLKVLINHNGIVVLTNAWMLEESQTNANGTHTMSAEQNPSKEELYDDVSISSDNVSESSVDFNIKKKKPNGWLIELPMEVETDDLSLAEVAELTKQEYNMVTDDVHETERVDARNALEEFMYDMRSKIQSDIFKLYMTQSEEDSLSNELYNLENWLYADGVNCAREVYVNKLHDLINRVTPIQNRANDYENAPVAFDELRHAIHNARMTVNEYKKGASNFEHMTDNDFVVISEAADKAQKWLELSESVFMNPVRTSECPIKVSEIRQETTALQAIYYGVINRCRPLSSQTSDINGNDQTDEKQNKNHGK